MSYSSSPFAQTPTLLLPGSVGYSFGSLSDRVPTTQMYVTASSESAGNTITLYVNVVSGLIPTTSQLVSTQGLTNVANQTNTAILSVTINAVTGVGTITFADATSAGLIAKAPDSGTALAPQPIVLVAPAATTVAAYGLPFSLESLQFNNNRAITWSTVVSGGTVSAVEFDLQGAANNIDSEYTLLDKSTATGGETRSYVPVGGVNFVRVKATLTYTGSPLIAAFVSI